MPCVSSNYFYCLLQTHKDRSSAPAFCCANTLTCLSLNIELLRMQRGIALDQNVLPDQVLEFREPAGVI